MALTIAQGLPAARADDRVPFLAERLKYPPGSGQADDFRVRTNAALALGATNSDDAVGPLCAGLADPSQVVRQAAAVALKRLGRASALECLKMRVTIETSTPVKVQVQRAIDAIETNGSGAGSPASSPAVPGAKYYVALSSVTNESARATSEIERMTREAVLGRLGQLGEYQVAPDGETPDAARAVIAKRKLRGYYLGISVEKFDYSGGNLRIRVRIAVFSYPGRDLRGEIPAAATLPGVRPGDKGAEDRLLNAVAGEAAELFAQNFR
jgi:hypothetical protein